mgnify:CR=1 FL=1
MHNSFIYNHRRYVVLIKTHLLTFKDDSGDYSSPTEIIPINNCCTVKSADDELNIKNSFVSPRFYLANFIFKIIESFGSRQNILLHGQR